MWQYTLWEFPTVCVARDLDDALEPLNCRIPRHVLAHRLQDLDIFTHRVQGVERQQLLFGDLKKTRLLIARRMQQGAGKTVQSGSLIVMEDPECRAFPSGILILQSEAAQRQHHVCEIEVGTDYRPVAGP